MQAVKTLRYVGKEGYHFENWELQSAVYTYSLMYIDMTINVTLPTYSPPYSPTYLPAHSTIYSPIYSSIYLAMSRNELS